MNRWGEGGIKGRGRNGWGEGEMKGWMGGWMDEGMGR